MDQQNYQAPQGDPSDNGQGLSIAAFVLGIVGIVGTIVSFFIPVSYLALVCEILALVFGAKGRQKSTLAEGQPSSLATAGLILGIIGLAITVIVLLMAFICALATLSNLALSGL